MPEPFLATGYDATAVTLSVLIATAASYVGLDLVQRMRSAERALALWWCLGGAVALGTGIWAMHFIGMLAFQLPVAVGYAPLPTALSWLAAVAMSVLALGVASRPRLGWAGLALGAVATGTGFGVMHYIGMSALRFEPGIQWQPGWVAASVVVAVGASALALWMFRHLHRLTAGRARRWQGLAAVVMAGGISGMHYTGMAAAAIPTGAVCLSAGQLRGDGLGVLVAGAALLLLGLAYFSTLLDERMQAQARGLAASLQVANTELQRAVLHDSLTNLASRKLLADRLAQAGDHCDARGTRAALLFIDLDGFKPLNDLFGHGFGDIVLCEVAHRLAALARTGDTVARLGGDEFVILALDVADTAAVQQLAQRVVATLAAPMQLSRREARLSASVGVAVYPGDGSAAHLLAAADTAMYAAKHGGGAQVVFFTADMETAAREQMELQRDLRLAIDHPVRGELSLHYQPKVSARDGQVTGVEALLRWRHPQRGMVGPVVFIPVAERFGLIDRLGAWVIDEACRQMCAWQAAGLDLRVAVNLSMHQLRQPGLVTFVQHTLQRHGLPASRLMFEITESAAMDDADATGRVFDELAALGTELSIDDFGTGYSSLAWLRRLPSRQLKIDRSFVKDLDTCSDALAIVEAVVGLAHTLGLAVVAEGVETAHQRDLLRHLQCDELQGYLFARPMPGEQLVAWLRERPAAGWQPAGTAAPGPREALLAAS